MAKIEDLVQDVLGWKMHSKAILLVSLIVLVLTACAPAINPTLVLTSTPQKIQTQTAYRRVTINW